MQVPGQGNAHAIVMFIGEGLGFQEDRQRIPFVSAIGKMLDGLSGPIGVEREIVVIANMVKCRTPENQDPAPPVEQMDSKLRVTFGRLAFGRYFPWEGITKVKGRLREKDGRNIFSALHLAAVVRRNELRPTTPEDFKAISEILKGEPKDVGIESTALNIPKENSQVHRLSLIGTTGPAAGLSAQVGPSAVNAEEESSPERLALF